MSQNARFRVDTKLTSLLAATYRSSEVALKELVDNAWDADAENVYITLPESLSNDPIIIEDDGFGMTPKEVQNEYLVIANDRRSRKDVVLTSLKKRKIKGKKGIGKFAGLMAAHAMTVETKSRGHKTSLHIDRTTFNKRDVDLEAIDLPLEVNDCNPTEKGTKIVLSNLSQKFAFPDPDKLKQLLVLEYGRQTDFNIYVNAETLNIEDIPGQTFSETTEIPEIGPVKLRFTIADGRQKLKHSGIILRVDGKVVGRASYLGLEQDEIIPKKLLGKVYGEIEADGLSDDVTADWGSIIENSKSFQKVEAWAQNYLRDKVNAVFTREISLSKARLQRTINMKLEKLPEYRRDFARKTLEKVLQKFYGESEEKIQVIVSVILETFERDEYWAIIQEIDDATRSDVATLADALQEFGLVDMAIMMRQAKVRLAILDELDNLINNPATLEQTVHVVFEKNLWLLGPEYSLIASNKSLVRIIADYQNKKFPPSRNKKRPDLFLSQQSSGKYLLIEFKRPSHKITRQDESQAQEYRDDLSKKFKNIEILVIGKERHQSVEQQYRTSSLTSTSYADILSRSRSELQWLLSQLMNEK
ncbi:MAG: DUF4263 domain-containing protein [Tissierellales bacterium]|nr:DUF4263 domain-containing protein [Tissierellales bacterium]